MPFCEVVLVGRHGGKERHRGPLGNEAFHAELLHLTGECVVIATPFGTSSRIVNAGSGRHEDETVYSFRVMGGKVQKMPPAHGISSPHGWIRAWRYVGEKCAYRSVERAWPVGCCAVAREIWVNALGVDVSGCELTGGRGENGVPMRAGLGETVEPNEADVRHCCVPRVVAAPG